MQNVNDNKIPLVGANWPQLFDLIIKIGQIIKIYKLNHGKLATCMVWEIDHIQKHMNKLQNPWEYESYHKLKNDGLMSIDKDHSYSWLDSRTKQQHIPDLEYTIKVLDKWQY